MIQEQKEYFAFISYKREDEKWAKWLQHKLEHYHLPSNVRKANESLPKSIRPIFKDTSELSAGVLADEIHEALEKSKYLIVICSPRAAQSQWVGKEVQSFIDMGRTKQIIPFIIGGTAFAQDPNEECFPSALLNLPKEQELLGVNINEMGRDAAAVKVVARMFDLKFDMLWQRYERDKRNQRNKKFAIIAGIVLLFALGASISLYKIANERDRANAEAKRANTEANRANAERKKTEQANASLEVAYTRLKIKNDSIELQNKLIVQQKKDLNRTNASLAQKNIALNNSRDSVLRINSLLGEANNELIYRSNTIQKQNQQILQSRDSLLVAKTQQDLTLAKAYLFQGAPELSAVSLYKVKQNYNLLDSLGKFDFSNVVSALNDTISVRPFSLKSISPLKKLAKKSILENDYIKIIRNEENEYYPNMIINRIDKRDTLEYVPFYNSIFNNQQTSFAIYNYPDFEIYSIIAGKKQYYFDASSSYAPNSSYPVALSNDATKIVYLVGGRFDTSLSVANMVNGKKQILKEWFCNLEEEVSGAFSSNDNFYFCRYEKSNLVDVYNSSTNQLMFTFDVQKSDTVYWDNNDLCLVFNNCLYKWIIDLQKQNRNYKDSSPIINVSISPNKEYIAIVNSKGNLILWNIKTNEINIVNKIVDNLQDVGFTQDGKSLWCISSYGTIKSLFLATKKTRVVYNGENFNPQNCYLHFPYDKSYCIAMDGWWYYIFDINTYRRISVEEAPPYNYKKPEREVVYNPEIDNSRSCVLTSRRFSYDGTLRVEGYSDGTVKVIDNRNEHNITKLFEPNK